jgi:hypothetical protein
MGDATDNKQQTTRSSMALPVYEFTTDKGIPIIPIKSIRPF